MLKTGLILSLSTFVLVACTDKNDGPVKEPVGSEELPKSEDVKNGGIISGELESTIKQEENGTYVYTVKNQTAQEMTLSFTSSQRFDFAVKTKEGEVLFAHSMYSSYLQAVGEEVLKQGEELNYMVELPNTLEKGEYQLEVWLTTADGELSKTSMTIEYDPSTSSPIN